MINVSNDFLSAMETRRDFHSRAIVTLSDGSIITFGSGANDITDFSSKGNSFSDSADGSVIPLGAAISRQIEIEVLNDVGQLSSNGDPIDFTGAQIVLFLDFALDNGTTEEKQIGSFNVVSPAEWGNTVVINASDDMIKADKPYQTNISFPATLGAVYEDACNSLGLSCVESIANSSFEVKTAPTSDYTYRQVFGYIAMLSGGNARINRYGALEIKPCLLSGNNYLTLHDWANGTFNADYTDTEITGIKSGDVLVGTEGYVLPFDNPLLLGYTDTEIQTILSSYSSYIGQTFRNFEGQTFAYPLAEFMDLAKIQNGYNATTQTYDVEFFAPLTNIEFIFGGKTTLKNSSGNNVSNTSTYGTEAQTAILESKKIVDSQRIYLSGKIDELTAETNALYNFIDIDPQVPSITIGSSRSSVEIDDASLDIIGPNGAATQLKDSRMLTNEMTINNTLFMGNFALVKKSANGNIVLKYIGA